MPGILELWLFPSRYRFRKCIYDLSDEYTRDNDIYIAKRKAFTIGGYLGHLYMGRG
jgi:hypothetical protein